MLRVEIHGIGAVELNHLVMDYNGTIAHDGDLLPGVAERIRALAPLLEITVLTADTHGTCEDKLEGLPCTVHVISEGDEGKAKRDFVRGLGVDHCAAVGNGRNDCLMLSECTIGIAVIQGECASARAVASADLIATDILSALDLFQHPQRINSCLRF
ncbi:HAD family hydrolase [Salidesulfovibrio onnuriiensis]|uniref:HAD family hydrolase n=1 Tax=Salidesulfovibrio onnuriiensis TaxID=2583823 RepID=UPI0011CB16AD|nr:HAD family hydrolase [Salidesulfovibrio onnuriiensis]